MALTTVIKDGAGVIRNIGAWDYRVVYQENGILGPDGNPVLVPVSTNPLPSGYVEAQADIVEGWDGGFYEATDPRRLPPEER